MRILRATSLKKSPVESITGYHVLRLEWLVQGDPKFE